MGMSVIGAANAGCSWRGGVDRGSGRTKGIRQVASGGVLADGIGKGTGIDWDRMSMIGRPVGMVVGLANRISTGSQVAQAGIGSISSSPETQTHGYNPLAVDRDEVIQVERKAPSS